MKKIIVAVSFLFIASFAHATDWSIQGEGVTLYMSQNFVPFESSPINNLVSTDNGISILSEYTDEKHTEPLCYMLRANKVDKVIYCQEKANWKLSNSVFYLTRHEVWNCVKNCHKNTPRVLKLITEEGD
jgi:hypothetical protein